MEDFKATLKNFPQFGTLQGLRIIDCGSFIAVPWAGTLAAECGAEVIKIENPRGDTLRGIPEFIPGPNGESAGSYWIQEARCKLDMCMDFRSPEAKDIMSRLIKESDIWMESSVPGTFPNKFGMTDEWIFEQNPKIVIVHVSGFGQTGGPEYVRRGSYDMIGQAFGGFCEYTGYPDQEPLRTGLAINDYITALWTMWSMLAAYIHAQRTGKGQVVDVAQYEAQARMLEANPVNYLMTGKAGTRNGNLTSGGLQPFGIYKCKDCYISVSATGPAYERIRKIIPGLEDEKFAGMKGQILRGDEIRDLTVAWLEQHTGAEVEKILNDANVPAARVMDLPAMVENSQYKARDMFIEWEDEVAGPVKGTGVVPKFGGTPSQVWRGAPALGEDTEAVLKRFGYSDEEIAAMEESGSVVQYQKKQA